MARLTLSLLGPLQVLLDGQLATGFESNKVRALLVYLAVESDRAHTRDSLAGLLWPDFSERSAHNNLRSALANLRGAIGDRTAEPPYLVITRESIRFNPASVHALDVAAFKTSAGFSPDQLAVLADSYRGEFLEGFALPDSPPFEAWVRARREQYKRQAMEILGRLGDQHESAGLTEQAVTCVRRQLELEAWDESAHRRLMRLLAMSGRRDLALAQYEIGRRRLRDELGVDPARETEALYEQIRDQSFAPSTGPREPEPPAPGLPPFKGLSFFEENDADRFFGREELTATLVSHVVDCLNDRPDGPRVLTVIGASGSGKSSIIRAGLVPTLRLLDVPATVHSGKYRPFRDAITIMTPTACPLDSLAINLTAGDGSVMSTAALIDDLARETRSLHLAVSRLIAGHPVSRLLLVVDQFEELFSLCRDEAARRAFIDNLLYAAGTDGPVIVVIALRADFYAQCAPYENLRRALTGRQVYIGAMGPEELRRAIEAPAAGDWAFEPGLVDLLLREVGDAPGALPLLSHALLETWRRREGRMMTLVGYQASGGVTGALARTAESAYRRFSPREQAIARNIFLRLTELDENVDEHLPEFYTRRRAALAELILRPEDATQVQAVLTRLADARLITTSRETAEVAHEALIREWPRLGDWLHENREGLRLHHQVAQSAQDWNRSARDPSLLYRGARLAQAGEWVAGHGEDLNELERAFLAAGRAEEEVHQQRELRAAQELAKAERRRAEAEALRAEEQTQAAAKLRQRAISLSLALGALAGLLLLAVWLGQTAGRNAQAREEQARLATSRELAAAAVSSLSADPERSVLLALEALETADTLEARNALHQSLPELHVQRIIPAHNQLGAPGVAFSPDGARLASIGLIDAGYVRVWDVATGEKLLELQDASGDFGVSVDYSHDGRLLASAWGSPEPKVVVWDAETGERLFKWPGKVLGDVDRLDFSPNGTLLAVANLNGAPTIFDLTTGAMAYTLRGHATVTEAIAFSPDGSQLATGDNDGMVKIWDAVTQEVLATFSHGGKIHAVAFSPEGQRLATAGEDGKLTVWDIPGERTLLSLPTRSGLYDVEFMPDGERVVGTHQEGAATVWDAASGQLLLNLVGHGSTVISVSAAPDNRTIATGGYDGTVRIWDTSPGREILSVTPHSGWALNSVAYRPYSQQLLTVSRGGSAALWETTTGVFLQKLVVNDPVSLDSVAFNPGGDLAAIGDSNGKIRLVDMATGETIQTINAHSSVVMDVAFSPNGTRLASASWDNTSKVWDVASGQPISTLAAPCWSMSVAWSPDGGHVFSSCGISALPEGADAEPVGAYEGDATEAMKSSYPAFFPDAEPVGAFEWDATTGQIVRGFPNDGVEIYGLALSPDGRTVALGFANGDVTLWDVAGGEKIHHLSGHAGIAYGMAFSPDGRFLATSAFDQLAKLWDVENGQEMATFYGNRSNIFEVAFNPDGTRLVTAGGDGTFRMFTTDMAELVELARLRITRSLTDEECRKYLHLDACPVN
jgi:WD40 repeat protein/DNA-binding SARP family transcriptional activator